MPQLSPLFPMLNSEAVWSSVSETHQALFFLLIFPLPGNLFALIFSHPHLHSFRFQANITFSGSTFLTITEPVCITFYHITRSYFLQHTYQLKWPWSLSVFVCVITLERKLTREEAWACCYPLYPQNAEPWMTQGVINESIKERQYTINWIYNMTWKRSVNVVNFLPKLPGYGPNQCIRLMQGSANFSVKSQKVNILGFVGHTISVSTTRRCGDSTKATIYNM